jgi:large subunit ribosomal protein L6
MKKTFINLSARQGKRFRVFYNFKELTLTGPLGKLAYNFPIYRARMNLNNIHPIKQELPSIILYDRGLLAWFKNSYKGVYSGFSQQIVLNSNSFKADYSTSGKEIILDLGFSHSVCLKLPAICKFVIQKRQLLFFSHSLDWLRSFSLWFQSLRYPDSYKAKGILFQGQTWKTKPGKQRQ